MVRTARFTAQHFVEAAIELAAEGGATAASPLAVAQKVGAPTGSLYHRFESRAALLATAWSQVHGTFVDRMTPSLRAGDGLGAALGLAAFARADALRARFLFLNEAGVLFGDVAPPAAPRQEIERQEQALDEAFQVYVESLPGQGSDRQALARFLVFDGPLALVRPHLLARTPLPVFVERGIAALHETLPARVA